jgi:hypothetical protein
MEDFNLLEYEIVLYCYQTNKTFHNYIKAESLQKALKQCLNQNNPVTRIKSIKEL